MNTPTIQDLYSEARKIEVKFKEHASNFSVEMIFAPSKYAEKPIQDCKIGSWSAKKFFRTEKGSLSEDSRYKTIGGLKRAIIMAAKKRNLTVESFVFPN